MCGILGVIGKQPDSLFTEKSLRPIKHRGPDDEGIWQNDSVSLGHVRLSIIDTSSLGHQPMISKDDRFILIYNGEIYNHLELREELKVLGHSFVSSSDTETLLYGLVQWGGNFIKRLNGIFAFAFYDTEKQSILLARDQLGVKPLYYFQNDNQFIFSSEAKAIINLLDHPLTIDPQNLINYITLLWCPGDGTPAREIKKVEPGHFGTLRLENSSIDVNWKKYYDIPFNGVYKFNAEKETVDLLEQKLTLAVKRQLLSDVPVGFFLSGGLDSSLLVAMARKMIEGKVQCFTIETDVDHASEGFTNDLYYAKRISRDLGVDLEIVKADIDILKDFDKMIWHLDEPQSDAAPLNVLNICECATAMGYKVLIGGTGGDDLFSGYRRHMALQGEKYWKFIPSFILKGISKIPLDQRTSLFRRMKKIMNQLGKPIDERLASYYTWMPPEKAKLLLSKECQEVIKDYDPVNYLRELQQAIPDENSWLNRMLYWEMKTFLTSHNLNYTDKMGMAKGVEIRVPYLDVELVEFACSIHPELKMKSGETKYILKKVAERYLPKEVIYRSKTGFGAPVRKWILEDLDSMISERLAKGKIEDQGIFNSDQVWQLIEDNRNGKIDASYSIWSLLAINSWMKQFMTHNKIALVKE